MNKHKLVFLIALLIILPVMFFNWYWRILYPLSYAAEIKEAAGLYGHDPALLASIIFVESRFNPQATSPEGAKGLMQIMPATAIWAAKKLNWKTFSLTAIENPRENIILGSWYLNYLKSKFSGNITLALAAYNSGDSTVEKWLTRRSNFNSLEEIPYPETKLYIKKVLALRKRYYKLYFSKEQYDYKKTVGK